MVVSNLSKVSIYGTSTMRETLINLVHQYSALWDKQDAMYKDRNYKKAKWKEIMDILHLNKDDVI